MIVVTGATGNIGKKIAELLLEKNQKVRVVGRNADRMRPLMNKWAEPFVGNVEKSDDMTRAFQGVEAAFIMIPPNYGATDFRAYQNKVSEAFVHAIKQSGIKYVVSLSSLGAHQSENMGPINGLYDHEQRLNSVPDVHVLHLRPTYFMENHLWNVGLIKSMGINGSPVKPDVAIPMIATFDIALEACERLIKRDFKGKTVKELLGARDLTMKEATKVLGSAIGKPDLKYVQFSYEDAEKAMLNMGFSADAAKLMIEMNKSINEGVFKPTQERSAQTTTKTSIEDFSRIFAQVFKDAKN